MKLRITGFLAAVVAVPDVVPDDDDPLEEPEPPLPLVLVPLLPELPLEPLLMLLLDEVEPLPAEDPLDELLEDDPDFELPLLDLLLLLLFVGVVV